MLKNLIFFLVVGGSHGFRVYTSKDHQVQFYHGPPSSVDSKKNSMILTSANRRNHLKSKERHMEHSDESDALDCFYRTPCHRIIQLDDRTREDDDHLEQNVVGDEFDAFFAKKDMSTPKNYFNERTSYNRPMFPMASNPVHSMRQNIQPYRARKPYDPFHFQKRTLYKADIGEMKRWPTEKISVSGGENPYFPSVPYISYRKPLQEQKIPSSIVTPPAQSDDQWSFSKQMNWRSYDTEKPSWDAFEDRK